MPRNEITVRVAGEGGEGVISTAEILTRSAVDAGLEVFTFRSYPAEIKGGLAMMQVRISVDPIHSIGRDTDILMAFNQEAFDVWGARMSPGAVLLFDPKHCSVPEDYPFQRVEVPLHEIAMRESGARIAKNIVALAAMIGVLDMPPEPARALIEKKFKRKGGDVVATNFKAFEAGYSVLRTDPRLKQLQLAPSRTGSRPDGRIVLSGNQALSLGAIAGGCRFVAGYPITPATQVLEFMMKHLPAFGGNVVQAEDEIAAIAACLGASYTGAKSMTATSGPGLCLMSELIGMASISEIPVVVVDVMRSGPGTGMPTKTEQADLMFAMHGSSGEAPRIVLAATSIEDCFHQAVNAFNLAERFQTPVILLSDQSMGYRTRTLSTPDLSGIRLDDRATPTAAMLENYNRFADTESGVSPVALPGMANGMFVATGLEHDEAGAANYTPENRTRMVAKRFRKLDTLAGELNAHGNGILDDGGGADIGVIGWGSTEGPIAEALEKLRAQGLKVAQLHPKVLNPLPIDAIGGFLAPLKKVVVFEENHTAQFSKHLRSNVRANGTEFVDVNQCTGLPFTSDEVYATLSEHV
ncbi:MAG TPA: 2-oxoacid:acceptor oxidoreductase subunit alpha [Candidatus Krumholzibacteria bacterium]|nr:2-oxoacid:acceptor oxidoreductase subunit alpha [Candidatus Krumholzibacteria bacterium]